MELEDYSLEELKQYVTEQEEVIKQESMPKLVANPDFSELIRMCEKYIKGINETGKEPFDEQYFIEDLLETVYGDDIYGWINEYLEEEEE